MISHWDPVLYDKDSAYVQALQQVYTDITQSDSVPVTTTGGTYAKIHSKYHCLWSKFPRAKEILRICQMNGLGLKT